MLQSKVINFGENPATATYADGLAFIERTRRQLDRYDDAFSHGAEPVLSPESRADIRREIDALEISIRKDIGDI